VKVKVKKEGKVKEYNIIDSWADVTLEKWQQLVLGKKKSKTQEAKETIKALSTLPVKLVEEMSLSDVATIFERLSKLQVKGKLKKVFEIDEVEYGFLPDLDEITLGEWADTEQYIKDGLEKNIHKIMAILFRPVTNKEGKMYSVQAYKDGRERAEKFRKKMNAEQVQQSLVFFWTFGKELSKILPLFLMEKMKKIQEEMNLQTNGGGSE
tara:strand:- start:7560 stop:8186 length:627 start_codon:yes stop_codon:yes gene_type:complete